MLLVNKTIYSKLRQSSSFWKRLCVMENFDKSKAIKNEKVNNNDQDRTSLLGNSGI